MFSFTQCFRWKEAERVLWAIKEQCLMDIYCLMRLPWRLGTKFDIFMTLCSGFKQLHTQNSLCFYFAHVDDETRTIRTFSAATVFSFWCCDYFVFVSLTPGGDMCLSLLHVFFSPDSYQIDDTLWISIRKWMIFQVTKQEIFVDVLINDF